MAAVLGSFDTITELVTNVWNLMTSNPLLALFLGVSLISIGVGVFMAIKNAARN